MSSLCFSTYLPNIINQYGSNFSTSIAGQTFTKLSLLVFMMLPPTYSLKPLAPASESATLQFQVHSRSGLSDLLSTP